jgi:signal transduction histidine kinase
MFSRASERSETGGIGLYITKTAAEKLGGTVHLKTTPEGYTEFYVKLPYATSRVFA